MLQVVSKIESSKSPFIKYVNNAEELPPDDAAISNKPNWKMFDNAKNLPIKIANNGKIIICENKPMKTAFGE